MRVCSSRVAVACMTAGVLMGAMFGVASAATKKPKPKPKLLPAPPAKLYGSFSGENVFLSYTRSWHGDNVVLRATKILRTKGASKALYVVESGTLTYQEAAAGCTPTPVTVQLPAALEVKSGSPAGALFTLEGYLEGGTTMKEWVPSDENPTLAATNPAATWTCTNSNGTSTGTTVSLLSFGGLLEGPGTLRAKAKAFSGSVDGADSKYSWSFRVNP